MSSLFSEFEPVSSERWKERIIKDLKGEAYESLLWHNENGIEVQPFYHADGQLSYPPAFTHSDWDICYATEQDGDKQLNEVLLRRLSQGASSILVKQLPSDLDIALKGVQLQFIRSTFYLEQKNIRAFFQFIQKSYGKERLRCTIIPSGISSVKSLREFVEELKPYAGSFEVLGCDMSGIHNLGANAVTELSWTMVLLDEYCKLLIDLPGVKAGVRLGVTADFFIEMAKLRALRRLFILLAESYSLRQSLHVISETSLTVHSVSDSYNNLLRNSVQAMAAIAGGCNELLVQRFDQLLKDEADFSARLAINQQLILKHESYFDQVADVACGSYAVETLTDELAKRALEKAKSLNAENYYKDAVLKENLLADYQRKEEEVFSGKKLVIGVNKFRNEKEEISLPENRLKELASSGLRNAVLKYELEKHFSLSHGLK